MNSESPTFPVPDAIPVSDAAAPVWFRRALKASLNHITDGRIASDSNFWSI